LVLHQVKGTRTTPFIIMCKLCIQFRSVHR